MQFKKTLLALSLGLALAPALTMAAPPLMAANSGSTAEAARGNAWLEIDKAALNHNLAELKRLVGADTKVCAILKADAYGHGIANVMPSIIAQGIPCVGIASNEEARVARASGYKGVVARVRSATQEEIADGLQYDMQELVGNLELARQASALAKRQGKTLQIHLAINSAGISRNGVELASKQGRRDALAMLKLPNLQVVGIMTHFPVEDKADVQKGLAAFNKESAWLIKAGGLDRSKITLHCANSFATLEVPEARLDMVRPGGAIFGDTVPSHTEYLRVMAFKSRVAAVNRYPAGNTVGYDRTYTLKRESLLANIPVGYSDGYRRAFTNKAHVLVNGQRAPVVGKVSMNTLMVDVTEIPGAKIGDEVVLFGKQGQAEISAGELEDINGALLADLYTVWGNSNPKLLVNR
ncbi:alanine racemase [Chromobacterium haemolyticum]|uniref:alanine racemase n=1 Tax=Chromobacterium haemolyticum TaxID=394935 RepID=UPI001315F7FE|nr:alanine racemase [Chromobacterium haemolyticum]BBH15467.1 alanine racemase [Chromobacterium haemolyticum]